MQHTSNRLKALQELHRQQARCSLWNNCNALQRRSLKQRVHIIKWEEMIGSVQGGMHQNDRSGSWHIYRPVRLLLLFRHRFSVWGNKIFIDSDWCLVFYSWHILLNGMSLCLIAFCPLCLDVTFPWRHQGSAVARGKKTISVLICGLKTSAKGQSRLPGILLMCV